MNLAKNFKLWIILVTLSFSFADFDLFAETFDVDIVIYGGSSAGVTAAVQAKRMGRSVVLISPEQRLGGMTTNGLSSTDMRQKEVVGGIAREFYHRVWRYYQSPDVWKWQKSEEFGNRGQGTSSIDGDRRTMWVFEPKVAEGIFESLILENEIHAVRNEWLDRDMGVEMNGGKIASITCLSGNRYVGKVFLDCTYEGDLMAAAGVRYIIGRESNDLYGETLNGVQVNNAKKNQFLNRIDPFLVSGDPSSGLLPGISNWTPSLDGRADDKIQAYNFRLCLTRIEDNQILFSMPEGYDPKLYELLLRTLNRGSRHIFAHFHPIPNSKTDTNNYGSFSTNFIGMNYGYPEGTYEKRREIVKEHENYLRGYFYFLTHDSRVPQDVRDGMSQWGLARDEFTSNRYWPEQIYVREARRMLGRFVMTEHEVAGRKTARRSIGMGLCNINSHNVQRYVSIDENGVSYVLNEGDFEFEVRQPYKISFDSLLPKRQECENLLVPVCLSASHVAFGSLREEAVFMILGQSAATAAALAVQKDVSLHELSYAELRENLLRDGQVLELKKLDRVKSGEGIPLISLGGVVVDGAMVELEGDWTESTSMRPFVGKSYFHDGNGNKGMCTAKFPFVAPMNGLHEIKVSFSSFGNRAGNLNYLINHEKGFSKVPVDQRKPQSIDDLWFSLGSFEFVKGKQYCVSLSNENTEGYVVADAIQVISLLSDPVQE